MTRWIELSAWVWLALAGAGVIISLVRVFRRRGPFCPGPRARFAALKPWRWFLVGDCGYDLSMVPAQPDGTVRCPECGGVHTRIPRRRTGSWRAVPWAVMLVLVGLTCRNVREIRRGAWVKPLPTTVLLVVEQLVSGPWTGPVRDELDTRLVLHRLTPGHQRRLVALAVAALANDRTDWNAQWGLSILTRMGEGVTPNVEAGLNTPDHQQRQLCAHWLRERWERSQRVVVWGDLTLWSPYTPPDRLFEVTVEGLASDTLPRDPASRKETWVANANDGLIFLLHHADRAMPFALKTLHSNDLQQRLYSAIILGLAAESKHADTIAPILIEHLRDNTIRDDAVIAMLALAKLGPSARSYLEREAAANTQQSSQLCRLILDAIENNTHTIAMPPEISRAEKLLDLSLPLSEHASSVREHLRSLSFSTQPRRRLAR